jgi:hypothetical protein
MSVRVLFSTERTRHQMGADGTDVFLQRGALFLNLGEAGEALRDVATVLRAKPTSVPGLLLRARVLHNIGRFQHAKTDLHAVLVRQSPAFQPVEVVLR